MRILSLNTWGGRVHEPLIPYLAAAEPDALCLQEMISTPSASAEWLIYRDQDNELLQRANLVAEVAAVLPEHEAFFLPAACGDLFDGEQAFPSDWGLATFVHKRYPVVGHAQDFVHGDFSHDGWGAHPRSRNAHAVRLYDYTHGSAVTVVHLHGLRDPGGKEDTPARLDQAARLTDLIRRLHRQNERLVLCGDFNVLPESKTFDILRDELGLVNLITAHGHTDTRTSYYKKSPRFADYMLVSPDVVVERFEVVREPEVSDHCALLLEIA